MTDHDAIRKKRAKARRARQNRHRLAHWTGAVEPSWDVLKRYYAALKAHRDAALHAP